MLFWCAATQYIMHYFLVELTMVVVVSFFSPLYFMMLTFFHLIFYFICRIISLIYLLSSTF